MRDWACPRCGLSDHGVPVWHTKPRFVDGNPPDYVGCMACREMEKFDDG